MCVHARARVCIKGVCVCPCLCLCVCSVRLVWVYADNIVIIQVCTFDRSEIIISYHSAKYRCSCQSFFLLLSYSLFVDIFWNGRKFFPPTYPHTTKYVEAASLSVLFSFFLSYYL